MAVTSPVKYFHSGMPGAPSLLPAWGSLTSLLDSLLIDGFGLVGVDSIAVSAGVATASISAGHVFQIDQVVKISGATQAAINDEFRVTARNATSFQFAAPVGVTTVTGTLSAKVAPLDWEIGFTGTNKRAYRSKNVQSAKNLLLINDGIKLPDYDTGWAKWANVGIVSAMSNIDTITGIQAPFNPAKPTFNWEKTEAGQYGWYKWYFGRGYGYDSGGDAGGAGRNWVLIGDDRLFYFFTTYGAAFANFGRAPYVFGDIVSYRQADVTGTILSAEDSPNSTTDFQSHPAENMSWGFPQAGQPKGKLLLRGHTQVGVPVRWMTQSTFTEYSGAVIAQSFAIPFPNAADYALWMLPTYCRQEDGNIRGLMPGLNWIPHTQPYPDLTVVDNVESAPGKKFVLVSSQQSSNNFGVQTAFDIVGPWR